jgi:hypothetical protein
MRDATICRIYISNENARNIFKKVIKRKEKKQDIRHLGLALK